MILYSWFMFQAFTLMYIQDSSERTKFVKTWLKKKLKLRMENCLLDSHDGFQFVWVTEDFQYKIIEVPCTVIFPAVQPVMQLTNQVLVV